MTEILNVEELEELGFQELEGDTLDEGYYRWWKLEPSCAPFNITYEYNSNDEVVCSIVEIANEPIDKKLSKDQVLQLVKIFQ